MRTYQIVIAGGLVLAGLTGCDSKASQERQQKLEAIVQTYSEDVSEVRTSKENAGEFYDHWSRTELAGYTVASILSGDNDQIISDAKVKAQALDPFRVSKSLYPLS